MLERMQQLKNNSVDLKLILDIGSYHGQFGDMCKEIWPNATVISVEANPSHARINPKQITACLSHTDGLWVEFFTPPTGVVETGASYLRELTPYYTNATTTLMKTQTLDTLYTQNNWTGTWASDGLLKLDTQGSELHILQGADLFLLQEKPRFILLEASHLPYNADAPSASEVVAYLLSRNYKWIDIWNQTRTRTNHLLQTDLLFERRQA